MFCLHKPYVKYVTQGQPFLNQATFNNLVKGLLDDNKCQISGFFVCSGPHIKY